MMSQASAYRSSTTKPVTLPWLNRRHPAAARSSQPATVFQASPSTREIADRLTPSTLSATTVSNVARRCPSADGLAPPVPITPRSPGVASISTSRFVAPPQVLGLDAETGALDAGSPPVDIVEGIVPVPLIFAVAPQIVDLEPPAPFAEGRPGQRRAAQARDIQVLRVVQGDADAGALAEMYVRGVSTFRVKAITEEAVVSQRVMMNWFMFWRLI